MTTGPDGAGDLRRWNCSKARHCGGGPRRIVEVHRAVTKTSAAILEVETLKAESPASRLWFVNQDGGGGL